MRFKLIILALLISILVLSRMSKVVLAASIPVSGKAKVLNSGDTYLDFTNYSSNVAIDDSTGAFSGYAFLEDLGWVAFGTADNSLGPVNVNLTSGAVSGKAKQLNTDAYVDFSSYSSNVTVAVTNGAFSGYAFSEDIGWLDFSDTGVLTSNAVFGNSTTSTTTSTSITSDPTCNDQAPSSAPSLYAASANGSNSINLYFTDAGKPVDHYALWYGPSFNDLKWGNDNIGGYGTREYTVGSLSPATTYYFAVRAGNGCATGKWSNTISASTRQLISFNELDISETEISYENICKTYSVDVGDTFWSIAEFLTGDGQNYQKLIDENQSKYPSLLTSSTIKPGWILNYGCSDLSGQEQVDKKYDLSLKIVDKNDQPIEGAKVSLYSKVREAITDKDGMAFFEDVSAGEHKVKISYEGFVGEQKINLEGNVKEFSISVKVEPNRFYFSQAAIVVTVILIIMLIGVTFYILKLKRISKISK